MSTALQVVKEGSLAAGGTYNTDRLSNVQRLGNILAASGYFSDVKDAAQAAVKVMAGEELGIAPVASVMGIHIIKGKVTLSANLIAAQVRRHGYDYRHTQFDAQGCSLQFFGKKGELLGDSSFTESDAKAAGVYSDMYKKFPRNMYFSRAMSNGARWYCPEVMSGLPVYVPEEMGAKVDGEGDVILEAQTESLPETGGHSIGTQAAADHVASKKIEELKKQNAEPRPSIQRAAEEIPADVQAMWSQMTDIKSTLNVFANLKKSLIESMGDAPGEREYYSCLSKHGAAHANQFKSTRPARLAAKDMLEVIRAHEGPPSEPSESEDSLYVTEADAERAQ